MTIQFCGGVLKVHDQYILKLNDKYFLKLNNEYIVSDQGVVEAVGAGQGVRKAGLVFEDLLMDLSDGDPLYINRVTTRKPGSQAYGIAYGRP